MHSFTKLNMRYPVNLELCEEGGYFVSFPDIPEALTQGDTREEALEMALDALITSFDFYFEDNRKIPLPGEIKGDFVDVPASVVMKILLLNEFLDSGITQTELAHRMKVRKQEVQRIIDIHHSTKIDTINNAFKAIGKEMVVSLR